MNEIWKYNPSDPLLFTQINFWVFFAVVMGVYALIFRKIRLRNTFLFIASLFFYYKSGGYFFILLLFSTVCDYSLALWIDRSRERWRRKALLIFSLVINLGILSYFKYTAFFTESLNDIFGSSLEVVDYLALWSNILAGSTFDIHQIILPVGISFYTFQTISYTVDVYRQRIKPLTNILDFGLYVTFFPQLVAGPIVRAADFVPQLHRNYQLSKREFSWALFLIINGLLKKVLISDYISINYVDRVFENPALFSGFENLMATYGYAAQIYCDFSGYTDIAIGIALMLGFRLPINFNSPYKALNITDFWRRWHISLSSWLKDYLYIPLGGSRHGLGVMMLALMLTMLLGGLWHGAHAKFILWGGLHGLALVVHKAWIVLVKPTAFRSLPSCFRIIPWLITFHFVCFAWLFFRAESIAQVDLMLDQMLFHFADTPLLPIVENYASIFLLIFMALGIHLLPKAVKIKIHESFFAFPLWLKALLLIFLVLFLYQIQSAESQPFIYFQF